MDLAGLWSQHLCLYNFKVVVVFWACYRHVQKLTEGVGKIDTEYDKCHSVWADGELRNFDGKSLSREIKMCKRHSH